MYANILVPVDGSLSSNQALEEAIRMAKLFDSKIEVIHVVDNSYLLYGTENQSTVGLREEFLNAGQGILEDAKKRIESAGVRGIARIISQPLAVGDVAGTILVAAQEGQAELVVIGSLGKAGNVAEKVMNQCPLPVWVIRGGKNHAAAS